MHTSIVRWGNSQGIRLPKLLLDSVNLSTNDIVEVTAAEGAIIIKKAANKSKRETIKDIFAGYDGGFFNANEIDWDEPQGDEAW